MNTISRKTKTKESEDSRDLEAIFGAKYMIQFRRDVRNIVLEKKDLSKIRTKREIREENIKNAPERAKSLISKLNCIVMLTIWGVTLILIYYQVPLIEQHHNLVALINTIPIIYAMEFSMRKFMIDTFSYKQVPTDKNELKFRDAWNRQLEKPSFLGLAWFMALAKRWFPKFYNQAMEYISQLFIETDSTLELVISAFRKEISG